MNGTTFTGDPSTIVLRPHQEIAIGYGPQTMAARLPSSYTFPQGD